MPTYSPGTFLFTGDDDDVFRQAKKFTTPPVAEDKLGAGTINMQIALFWTNPPASP